MNSRARNPNATSNTERLRGWTIAGGRDDRACARMHVKWSNDRLHAVGLRRIAPIQFTQRRQRPCTMTATYLHQQQSSSLRFFLASSWLLVPFFFLRSSLRHPVAYDAGLSAPSFPTSRTRLISFIGDRRSSRRAICRPSAKSRICASTR